MRKPIRKEDLVVYGASRPEESVENGKRMRALFPFSDFRFSERFFTAKRFREMMTEKTIGRGR